MKRNALLLIVMFLLVTFYLNIVQIDTAQASEINAVTPTVTVTPSSTLSNIVIQQFPSKTTYYQGESLDLTGMVLQGTYSDGTTAVITDYQVSGFDSTRLGNQTVTISSQGFIVNVYVSVLPAKVTNISEISYDTTNATLTWDAVPGAIRYEIYRFDVTTQTYIIETTTTTNSITLNYPEATYRSLEICAVVMIDGIEYKGGMSDTFIAATAPQAVTGLVVTGTTSTSVSLSWEAVPGATGYIVYRSDSSGAKFNTGKTVTTTNYTNLKLSSGKGYQFKVAAYTYNKKYVGEASLMVDTSTNPAKMVLKLKAGEEKVRITWDKVNGASTYDIYMGDDIYGYSLVTTRKASSTCSYTVKQLETGRFYSFYAIAHRTYNEVNFDSEPSDINTVEIAVVLPTSTEAKLFKTKKEFLNSATYKDIEFFHKYVNYSKSFIIPGLITTNVNGFASNTMCPQSITFAGNYLLQTAYDKANEENSVIYVMDKASKVLLTTLVLPSKAHLGGITFDDTNIWITRGTSVSSIQFSQVEEAVASGAQYYPIKLNSSTDLKITASYITYYDGKLWAGTYNELVETKMYSYQIDNKDTTPVLTKMDTMQMPTRVQGVVFTGNGDLILSRSCQLYVGLRGYMRQIDMYKPDLANADGGIIALGDLVSSVEMPSMNEGIAINGSYVYVIFESGAFEDASFQMDRICAFKISSLLVKKVVK